jgi:hypothetical protein
VNSVLVRGVRVAFEVQGFCDFPAIEGMTKEASELVAWRMRR